MLLWGSVTYEQISLLYLTAEFMSTNKAFKPVQKSGYIQVAVEPHWCIYIFNIIINSSCYKIQPTRVMSNMINWA